MAKLQKSGERAICHVEVMKVARAAAGELYEKMMGNNQLFMTWKKQNPGCGPKTLEKRFIDRNWPQCIEFARTTLTILLTQPDVEDGVKDKIMEVLELDQQLRNRQVQPRLANGTHYGVPH